MVRKVVIKSCTDLKRF